MEAKVKVWEEEILLPTYEIGQPEKNPLFLEKRVYQGSSGAVYPYPVIESIGDCCTDKPYKAVFLENEYLRIMVLPELGGRIQQAYDKLKGRHFIYYNQVIKPALVGLTGPWISGGIEFNWPQHHRPSTFLPVDYTLEECPDGSAIVRVGERERMFHQKGMAAFKLSPGRAVLEIQGTVYNPTPLPQTFLWWANPAVKVNEHYQSVFPDDVHAVFDHGKRDVSSYPIATGTYYKVDYSAGVDISRYRNIPAPTSYMAIQSAYDFVGGYENDTRAGVLHVANHHISPGKKQWTWGNGDFGLAWDRNLTDADGPYIELMAGVYTDNQPDFSWLQPYEEKSFTQYFLPYRELGVVKNATADLLMNLEETADGSHILKVFATSLQRQLRIRVQEKGTTVFEETTDLSPENVYEAVVPLKELKDASCTVYASPEQCLLAWSPPREKERVVPEPAKAARKPAEIASIEQLYLTGLHLEQYRHATWCPTDYYREALRREPTDTRCNNALGLWLLRKGQFAAAEPYLRQAVTTWIERNPNPYDGEAYYNLGLCLTYLQQTDEAYACFYKACWNAAWQDAGYFALAQLSLARNEKVRAREEIEKSLVRNWHNHRARHLKAVILRREGKREEALAWIGDSLAIDAFNFGCRFEQYLLSRRQEELDVCTSLMRKESHNYLELASDYLSAACYDEALEVIETALRQVTCPEIIVYYYKACLLAAMGRKGDAVAVVRDAERLDPGCCFPNRLETIRILQTAIGLDAHTPKALYLLGNFWYDKRQYEEAIGCWERSLEQDGTFPTVMRNLALAYFNKQGKVGEAVTLLEKAFALDTSDARILMELDQLYKRLNRPPAERFAWLERYRETVWKRDDLYLSYVTLCNRIGHPEQALSLIRTRTFHPWEGGEGKVPAQYQAACVTLARQCLESARYEEGLEWIEACYQYPHNLGEGKLPGAQENDFDYYKGCLLDALGRTEEAKAAFQKGAEGRMEPAAAVYYNDQKPEKIYFQGLCLRQSGREEEARDRFRQLIAYGEQHIDDRFTMDYFAVSLPDLQIWEEDMDAKNRDHCCFLTGLGYLGLGDRQQAVAYFDKCTHTDLQDIVL